MHQFSLSFSRNFWAKSTSLSEKTRGSKCHQISQERYEQSRSYFDALIQQGAVKVNGRCRKKSFRKFQQGAAWMDCGERPPNRLSMPEESWRIWVVFNIIVITLYKGGSSKSAMLFLSCTPIVICISSLSCLSLFWYIVLLQQLFWAFVKGLKGVLHELVCSCKCHGQLGIVNACIWRAVSWLLAHGLAPAYEEWLGPGSTTEQGTRLCPPVVVWKGVVFSLV